mmetsp:Transcript_47473/g.34755  ORF Transcript_47473/g.34755 Transcript_47473/m.34755 type:complete len:150 (+) Transcript_47473:150-599(+)
MVAGEPLGAVPGLVQSEPRERVRPHKPDREGPRKFGYKGVSEGKVVAEAGEEAAGSVVQDAHERLARPDRPVPRKQRGDAACAGTGPEACDGCVGVVPGFSGLQGEQGCPHWSGEKGNAALEQDYNRTILDKELIADYQNEDCQPEQYI